MSSNLILMTSCEPEIGIRSPVHEIPNGITDWFCSVCLATLFPFHHFLDDTDFFFADFLLFFHSVTLCIQSGTNVKKLETVT